MGMSEFDGEPAGLSKPGKKGPKLSNGNTLLSFRKCLDNAAGKDLSDSTTTMYVLLALADAADKGYALAEEAAADTRRLANANERMAAAQEHALRFELAERLGAARVPLAAVEALARIGRGEEKPMVTAAMEVAEAGRGGGGCLGVSAVMLAEALEGLAAFEEAGVKVDMGDATLRKRKPGQK